MLFHGVRRPLLKQFGLLLVPRQLAAVVGDAKHHRRPPVASSFRSGRLSSPNAPQCDAALEDKTMVRWESLSSYLCELGLQAVVICI